MSINEIIDSRDFKRMYIDFYKDEYTIQEFVQKFKDFWKVQNNYTCFEDYLQSN
jgi:hypothetical protein